jgi:serine protease inhibitor
VITRTAIALPDASMVMNHPFFYAIADGSTGELLHCGILASSLSGYDSPL